MKIRQFFSAAAALAVAASFSSCAYNPNGYDTAYYGGGYARPVVSSGYYDGYYDPYYSPGYYGPSVVLGSSYYYGGRRYYGGHYWNDHNHGHNHWAHSGSGNWSGGNHSGSWTHGSSNPTRITGYSGSRPGGYSGSRPSGYSTTKQGLAERGSGGGYRSRRN
ncbi:MAG TPA: hypothetical protein VHM91_21290 [Verrucomicrobiales bacterium]|nr:hypothetical protein [Verrucomicrobiales bacterium]